MIDDAQLDELEAQVGKPVTVMGADTVLALIAEVRRLRSAIEEEYWEEWHPAHVGCVQDHNMSLNTIRGDYADYVEAES